jgi:hypothetical protein
MTGDLLHIIHGRLAGHENEFLQELAFIIILTQGTKGTIYHIPFSRDVRASVAIHICVLHKLTSSGRLFENDLKRARA